jgi:CBS-domain-containing membrane protein
MSFAAAKLMVEYRVSGLPVVDAAKKVIGLVTEGDLLHRAETETGQHSRSRWMSFLLGQSREAADYVESHTRRVSDLMTTDVVSVSEDATLQEVVDRLERRHIRRVPVLRDGVLVGVVSRLDLVRLLAAKLEASDAGESDDALEQRLRRELNAQPWIAAANVGIVVKDKIIRLDGYIYDERVRKALVVAAENSAPGVRVDDRMVWMDPSSGLVLAGP